MDKLLKSALIKSGMSQKELAEKLFVTPQAVSKWLKGECRPSYDNIIEIRKILGIDLLKLMSKKEDCCSNHDMNHSELSNLTDYEKAKDEAQTILFETGITSNYSYSVYMLCKWLLTATIGLTYHQMINNTIDDDDEIDYYCIFSNLGDYLEVMYTDSVEGLYENYLEYNFYLMGGDLFESFDDDKLSNHEYCQKSLEDWHRFEKAIIKSPTSPLYNEFLVALTDIISSIN